MGDGADRGGRRGHLVRQEPRGRVGRPGEDHGLRRQPCPIRERHRRPAPRPLQGDHPRAQPDLGARRRADRVRQGVDEAAHAAGQAQERRAGSARRAGRAGCAGRAGLPSAGGPGRARPGAGPGRAALRKAGQEEASMLALVLPELRDDGEQAQLVDRRPVDPAEERVRQAIYHRPARGGGAGRPRSRRPRRRASAAAARRRPARIFCGQEKRRVVTKGAIRVGRTRPIPSGIGIISPRARMWTRRGSFVRMIVVAQAQLAGELGRRRPVGDERVGPGLHEEAVDPLRADLAAEPVRTPRRGASGRRPGSARRPPRGR